MSQPRFLTFAVFLSRWFAGLYNAEARASCEAKQDDLAGRFARVEEALGHGPCFDGSAFTLIDAAFGPVFRYFDTFEDTAPTPVLTGLHNTAAWRCNLGVRASVRGAVLPSYPENLLSFLQRRQDLLGGLACEVAETPSVQLTGAQ